MTADDVAEKKSPEGGPRKTQPVLSAPVRETAFCRMDLVDPRSGIDQRDLHPAFASAIPKGRPMWPQPPMIPIVMVVGIEPGQSTGIAPTYSQRPH